MKLENVIIGLAIMIVSLLGIMSIAIDMYQPRNYDINLSDDVSTAGLYDIQEKANEAFDDTGSAVNSIRDKTPGQNESVINAETGLTEYDLQKSATSALADTDVFLGVFGGMLTAFFNNLQLSSEMRTIFIWFIGLLIIVPIVLMIINSFLKNPLRS